MPTGKAVCSLYRATPLANAVTKRDGTMADMRVHPLQAGLVVGRFRWSQRDAESQYDQGPCKCHKKA